MALIHQEECISEDHVKHQLTSVQVLAEAARSTSRIIYIAELGHTVAESQDEGGAVLHF